MKKRKKKKKKQKKESRELQGDQGGLYMFGMRFEAIMPCVACRDISPVGHKETLL